MANSQFGSQQEANMATSVQNVMSAVDLNAILWIFMTNWTKTEVSVNFTHMCQATGLF